MYVNWISETEPLFTIGPDWRHSIVLLIATNALVGVLINFLEHDSFMFHTCYLSLVAWNLVFIYMCLLNPGLAISDPRHHTNQYLMMLTQKNVITRVCRLCNVIHREGGPFRTQGYCRTVEHCFDCGVCIEGQDHHEKWIGKCIGWKTANLYSVFIFLCMF